MYAKHCPAFDKERRDTGAAESFPRASITFDRFHGVKLLFDAMNKVRIDARKEHAAA